MKKKVIVCIMMLLFIPIVLSGCRLYTVVPLSKNSSQSSANTNQFNTNNFNADDYVKKVWDSKAIPEFEKKAVDLSEVVEGVNGDFSTVGKKYGITTDQSVNNYNFIVKGTLKVDKIDTQLRAGTIDCTLPGYNGKINIKLQIGPVFTSSSVRDSLSFVKFGDFQNQVVFDSVSDAFNKYIYDNIISKTDVNSLKGKTVTFIGTFTGDDPSNVSITPVELRVD